MPCLLTAHFVAPVPVALALPVFPVVAPFGHFVFVALPVAASALVPSALFATPFPIGLVLPALLVFAAPYVAILVLVVLVVVFVAILAFAQHPGPPQCLAESREGP